MSNHPTIAALKARLESEREISNPYLVMSNTSPKIWSEGHEAATRKLLPLIQKALEMAYYYANELPYRETTETMNYCSDDCPPGCNEHSWENKVKMRPACHSKQIARDFQALVAEFTKEK